jgi:hypothetical protein
MNNRDKMPQDERAEKIALGILIGHPDKIDESELTADDFHHHDRRQIFGILAKAHEHGDAIETDNLAALFAGHDDSPRLLAEAVGCTTAGDGLAPIPSLLPGAIVQLRDSAQRRCAKLAAWKLEKAADDPGPDWLDQARSAVEPLNQPEASTRCARSLAELESPDFHPGDELLRHRFLCRGGGALLVAPTGIGKSVMGMQAGILWALGRTCFDIQPARPLRSLIIQAENDDGDLWEMADGIVRGLELSKDDASRAKTMILFENVDSRTGSEFLARDVGPLVRTHKPDLVWIDPALAYLGGDASKQADVSAFLRNGLNPILRRHRCAAILVHHTAKPPKGEEKAEWGGNDFAYFGLGSVEWANWARAVIAIRGLKSNTVFELRLGKRGARVGWKDHEENPKFDRLIQHSAAGICWIEADEIDRPNPKTARAKKHTVQKILDVLGDDETGTAEWQKAAYSEAGVPRSSFYDLVDDAKAAKFIYKSATTGKWRRWSGKSEKSEQGPNKTRSEKSEKSVSLKGETDPSDLDFISEPSEVRTAGPNHEEAA